MSDAGLIWQGASVTMFAYLAAAGLARGTSARSGRAIRLSVLGIVVAGISTLFPADALLRRWLIPPALLLIAYWSSGALFVAPMPRAEAALIAVDRWAGIGRWRVPRVVAELLEVAYLGVYPLIPIALVLYLTVVDNRGADRFWNVVLVTDYACFALLPWVQTRPPRSLEGSEPYPSSVRALNLRIVGAASIQVNTFPSGHAAEALVVALLVCGGPAWACASMLVAALAVSAGAVLGRYHYLADAIAGWVVATAVWTAIGR